MVFQFQLLGLFLLFFLIVYYYSKNDYKSEEHVVFRGILLSSYLLQLLYIAVFVAWRNGCYVELFTKFYFANIVLVFSLLVVYEVSLLYRERLKLQQTLLNSKIAMVKKIFVVGNVLSCLLIIFSSVSFVKEKIYLYEIPGVLIILFFCCMLQLLLWLFYGKCFDSVKRKSLFYLIVMQIFILGLQSYFGNLTILPSGMVFLVFYLYMMLENLDLQQLEVLQLERDHALENSIDKSTFLRNLSHEIRIPINTIDGFSQVMVDTDHIEEMKEDAKDIRVASRDLIDIINGTIDLSIIESGKLEIIYENYNVYDMFQNIENIVTSKLRDREVTFSCQVDSDIPQVLFGDAERISQVLLNLLMNSIKNTERGNITLKVDSIKSNSRCRLLMQVIDTGKGMTKEELNSLFDSKDDSNGKAIGLRVVKYLVDLMHGRIDVENNLEKGTTITVTLDQKIIALKQEKQLTSRQKIQPFQALDKRILIVDDNKLNLKVATKLLSPYGMEVVEAASGQECLDILDRDTSFDLILMDDLMPGLSGTEVMDIIKKIQRVEGYYIPIVVLTANAVSGMKEKYITAGFDDYLSKPIDRVELDRILRKYLRGRKS